jgi:hypothetical protein
LRTGSKDGELLVQDAQIGIGLFDLGTLRQ